jgi:hypothetical protein
LRRRARAQGGHRHRAGRAVGRLLLVARAHAGAHRRRVQRLLVAHARRRLRPAHALPRRGHRVALERVVLARLLLGGLGVSDSLDGLQPEEDDGDVVPAARVVGRVDQPRADLPERRPARQQLLEVGLVDHRGQAVGAEHEDVAPARGEDFDIDLNLRLWAKCARDDRALRVCLSLLLRELAARDQLADERVVAREADEVAVAQQVRPRVAHVGHRHGVGADVGGGDRRPHAGALVVGA